MNVIIMSTMIIIIKSQQTSNVSYVYKVIFQSLLNKKTTVCIL